MELTNREILLCEAAMNAWRYMSRERDVSGSAWERHFEAFGTNSMRYTVIQDCASGILKVWGGLSANQQLALRPYDDGFIPFFMEELVGFDEGIGRFGEGTGRFSLRADYTRILTQHLEMERVNA